MVSAGDFRNGLTIEIDGTVYQVIEFQHVKPGKGAAFVEKRSRWRCCGEDIPSDREVSTGAY